MFDLRKALSIHGRASFLKHKKMLKGVFRKKAKDPVALARIRFLAKLKTPKPE